MKRKSELKIVIMIFLIISIVLCIVVYKDKLFMSSEERMLQQTAREQNWSEWEYAYRKKLFEIVGGVYGQVPEVVLHDFDEDGVPELILLDHATSNITVSSYVEEKVQTIAWLPMSTTVYLYDHLLFTAYQGNGDGLYTIDCLVYDGTGYMQGFYMDMNEFQSIRLIFEPQPSRDCYNNIGDDIYAKNENVTIDKFEAIFGFEKLMGVSLEQWAKTQDLYLDENFLIDKGLNEPKESNILEMEFVKRLKESPYPGWKDAYESMVHSWDKITHDKFMILATHDFDEDEIPELIISDDNYEIAIYSFNGLALVKVGSISWVGGVYFTDNTLMSVFGHMDGCFYHCFTYRDGEYLIGSYDDFHPDRAEINYEEVTSDFFKEIYPVDLTIWRGEKWKYYTDDMIVRSIDTKEVDLSTVNIDTLFLEEKSPESVTYSDWKKAYETTIQNWKSIPRHRLMILAIHDFNKDDIPELIISNEHYELAIYTFVDSFVVKVGSIDWLNGVYFAENTLFSVQNNIGGNSYQCVTYKDGEYLTGYYDDFHPDKSVINKEEVTSESFHEIFPLESIRWRGEGWEDYKKDITINEIDVGNVNLNSIDIDMLFIE